MNQKQQHQTDRLGAGLFGLALLQQQQKQTELQRQQLNLLRGQQGLRPLPSPEEIQRWRRLLQRRCITAAEAEQGRRERLHHQTSAPQGQTGWAVLRAQVRSAWNLSPVAKVKVTWQAASDWSEVRFGISGDARLSVPARTVDLPIEDALADRPLPLQDGRATAPLPADLLPAGEAEVRPLLAEWDSLQEQLRLLDEMVASPLPSEVSRSYIGALRALVEPYRSSGVLPPLAILEAAGRLAEAAGQNLSEDTERCVGCGSDTSPGALFCMHCGAPVTVGGDDV